MDPPIAASQLREHEPTQLVSHGEACCRRTWGWLRMLDRSCRPRTSPYPRWLTERFSWGPTDHPLAWCGLEDGASVDCGTHAAVARNLLEAGGARTVAVQLVERYPQTTIELWRESWGPDNDSWLADRRAYHEVVGVVEDDRLTVYDPLDGRERRPRFTGYGDIVALRVSDLYGHGVSDPLEWTEYALPVGEWWEPP